MRDLNDQIIPLRVLIDPFFRCVTLVKVVLDFRLAGGGDSQEGDVPLGEASAAQGTAASRAGKRGGGEKLQLGESPAAAARHHPAARRDEEKTGRTEAHRGGAHQARGHTPQGKGEETLR